ncbi:MAG: DUF4136 domain-containing protein [Polyangiaceae bacterium]|jgi:hypothetical protein
MNSIAIGLAITVAACQATTSAGASRIQASSAEPVAFASYRTFGFRLAGAPPFPYDVSARSFEVERRVHDLVATALAHKGYMEAGTTPDFLVRLSSGTFKEDEPLTAAGAYGTGNVDYRVRNEGSFTSGEIVVDAFDGSTAQQVWHGTAQADIDPHRINEAAIESLVDQMLMHFPARDGAPESRTSNR